MAILDEGCAVTTVYFDWQIKKALEEAGKYASQGKEKYEKEFWDVLNKQVISYPCSW